MTVKKHLIILSTLLVLFFIGLLYDSYFTKNELIEKRLIEKSIKEFLQASLEGNIEVMEKHLSKQAFDLGGGLEGDGRINFEKHKSEVQNYVNSEEFKERTKRLTLDNTLRMNELQVYYYSQISDNKSLQIENFGFKILPGDFLVIIPPQENSYFKEGITAYYRKENGEWKIIATN